MKMQSVSIICQLGKLKKQEPLALLLWSIFAQKNWSAGHLWSMHLHPLLQYNRGALAGIINPLGFDWRGKFEYVKC